MHITKVFRKVLVDGSSSAILVSFSSSFEPNTMVQVEQELSNGTRIKQLSIGRYILANPPPSAYSVVSNATDRYKNFAFLNQFH